MRLVLTISIIAAASSCRSKPADQTSNAASINISEISQSVLANDGFKIRVKTAAEVLSFTTKEELAGASFSEGDQITVGMDVFKDTKIVAKTISGDSRCPEVKQTLTSGKNSISLPLCLVDESGNPMGSTVSTPDDSDVDITPCITGTPGCDTQVDPTPPKVPPQTPEKPVKAIGACFKENASWKSVATGCKFVKTGLIFSAISNKAGKYALVKGANAKAHCDNLNESSVSDWRLPTLAEVHAINGSNAISYLNLMDGRLANGGLAALDEIGEIYVVESKASTTSTNGYFTYHSLQTKFSSSQYPSMSQFCVRKEI